ARVAAEARQADAGGVRHRLPVPHRQRHRGRPARDRHVQRGRPLCDRSRQRRGDDAEIQDLKDPPVSRRVVLLAAALVATLLQARADDFPARVVTIVSPYQAGGTSDIIARLLAQKLSERWGKSVIIENKPGANGGIGVTTVMQSAPDGHTLLAVASSALTINPIFYSKLPYDVGRDLAPVTRTGVVANVLVVHPSVPADNVQALIALAKAKPGQLNYASQGIGSNGQM